MDPISPPFLRFSDLLRKSHIQTNSSGKKGKGKVVAVDFAANLLENVNRAQEDFQYNLIRFQNLLQEAQNISNQPLAREDLKDEEYGSDLSYNDLPTSYYYEDLPDSNSDILEEFQDVNVDSFDKIWLLRRCELHISKFGDADGAITPTNLCTRIFTILRLEMDDDEIQAKLVDLLGFENFEFVTMLITKRSEIGISEDSVPHHRPTLLEPIRPSYGSQVTIQFESDAKQQKRIRKEHKKNMKKRNAEDEETLSANILGFSDESRLARENQLRTARNSPLPPQFSAPTENFKHVYGKSQSGSVLTVFGNRFSLPVGTERKDYNDYEEITVPMTNRAPPLQNEKLVYLSEMDNLCKGTFKNYKSLNRVQSIVYPVAYQKDENMLICAPTGAGKTEIATLAILRTLRRHCNSILDSQKFEIRKHEFKIVYIAPMKALAAEIVRKFEERLKWLGIQVKELTGDMQLTKAEISNTQILVTTPEKWDVVTRKSTGDVELTQKVKLLIIDEVHLLHDDRGAVLESLVARTRRQVETNQSTIRIVGLSATLPNYVDVARFLGVDLSNGAEGLFYFDGGFRPVPLEQHYIGVKGKPGTLTSNSRMNRTCWEKVLELVKDGHQVMVFVHARKETVRTAKTFCEYILTEGHDGLFDVSAHPRYDLMGKSVAKSRNKELKELFTHSFGIHHAGMLRSDRTMTERLFEIGLIKVLFCTATLAWGVNLPAHAVVIKGTQVYDAQKGNFVDLSILDVMQIFGRAGRPQYESYGTGYILTTLDKLPHYVSMMTQQHPIESKFVESIVDNLNAEISLGTVSTVAEGVTWLGYT
ncbi:14593_t:CDS:10, partial [Acaulospora morrowiae]